MKYSRSPVALDYSDCKQAALYFEHVIPLNTTEWLKMGYDEARPFFELLPPDLVSWKLDDYLEGLAAVDEYFVTGKYKDIPSPVWPIALLHNFGEVRQQWFENFRAAGHMSGIPPSEIEIMAFYQDNLLNVINSMANSVSIMRDEATEMIQDNVGTDIHLCLQNLHLIDTKNASWSHILEIRKDPEAIARLRNLKTFFYSTYKDKPLSFVEDDLARRMEEYKVTANKWGFDLRISVLDSILSSKTLLASAVGSLAAVAFNAPNIATIAASGGAVAEIGKIAIQVVKAQRQKIDNVRFHPLEFIFSTQKKLS